MTEIQQLAQFVNSKTYSDLSEDAIRELKLRLLDALACAIGAQNGYPIKQIKKHTKEFGGNPLTSLIGCGCKTAPDRTAFYNSALIRYLDYNDSYLAKNETCHPSDNIGSILTAAEYADKQGKDFLTALAIAYQVQCRLSDEAPVRGKGFDHTVQGNYGVAAGTAHALGLTKEQTSNALSIAGTAYNALRVTRTGNLSHWKGLAFPSAGWASTHAAFLAKNGITGPEKVFEGNKGFKDSIAGKFNIDWSKENLERVTKTIIKKYNAEIHSQATLEGVEELMQQNPIVPKEIETVVLNTFDVAYNIIGGGEEGSKKNIHIKEEADHSLPYMMAAMILDGRVLPAQYRQERIQSDDIQSLLQKVEVRESKDYSERFPQEMACDITIKMKNGQTYSIIKKDYEGFHTRRASWETIEHKFKLLSDGFICKEVRQEIVKMVKNIENYSIKEFMATLKNCSIDDKVTV